MRLKSLFLAAMASVFAFGAEAEVILAASDGRAVVQNTDAPFDKGNFIVGGKAPSLVVPESPEVGLVKGAKVTTIP